MGTPTTSWDLAENAIKTLPEEGPVTPERVRIWWKWHDMLVNILEDRGCYYRGESFKDQGWSTLLVLKVAVDGIPQVAFFTERTPTDCMRVCLLALDEGRIQWREDRFA